METTSPQGPKGHFWKRLGIWSLSSSARAVVKSCYFLASDKRLLRSCPLCFCWGRLDWGRAWVRGVGMDSRAGGLPEPQTCMAPKLHWWYRGIPDWTIVKTSEGEGTLRLWRGNGHEPPSEVGKAFSIKRLTNGRGGLVLRTLKKNSSHQGFYLKYI